MSLLDLDRAMKPVPPADSKPMSLDRGVLEQLETLRGRHGSGKLKGLAALLSREKRPSDQEPTIRAMAYDLGAPIRVNAPPAAAFSTSTELEDVAEAIWALPPGDTTEAFTVESFDQEAPPILSSRASVIPPDAVEAALSAMTPTVQGAGHDAPLGIDLSATAEAGLSDDADAFEREIQAIVSGAKARPAAQSAASDSSEQSLEPLAPPPRPHDVFEQMGRNMAFATEFRLPAVALSKTFDAIEAEIARDERDRLTLPELTLALSNEDITEGLAGMAAFEPIPPVLQPPPPAASAPGFTATPMPPVSPPMNEPGFVGATPQPVAPPIGEPGLIASAPAAPPSPNVAIAEPTPPPTPNIGESR